VAVRIQMLPERRRNATTSPTEISIPFVVRTISISSGPPRCSLTVISDDFIPESVDPTKPGSIEVKKGTDHTGVVVEHLGVQVGERLLVDMRSSTQPSTARGKTHLRRIGTAGKEVRLRSDIR
jgi:hypothetical protein